ncbi:LPS-assembly protein LptD [Paucibacter sp. Y2R2-4]|uniref:LPS-assembly protein LptD n=1 Tax=Paucibacter sp. Y2R2-4 TaxID=2893553 RepID=UPI0021E4E4A3|nr:LPS assembly protein LptD [Paucibacter sp. Y2R2-4]MCV2351333.1 LPS assembly protein LptD [Paucibacter sp. Y2R2-4]
MAASSSLRLKPAKTLGGSGQGEAKPALVLSAKRLNSQLDEAMQAEGEAELRYGDLLVRAKSLRYEQVEDLATARGDVEVSRAGNLFRGPELQLYLKRFEGEFLNPSYFFSLTGGGGHAAKVSFDGPSSIQAQDGTYSSCPANEDGTPLAWEVTARHLDMNFEANEGVATGAMLHFYGVPILPVPVLSFPLGGERKSGWLAPNMGFGNRSGVEFGMPYYWNIAPQRDATLTPYLLSRRGAGLDSEFRYLEPEHAGKLNLAWLPHDRITGDARWALNLDQKGSLGQNWFYKLRAERVSDDDYWKDLPDRMQSQTERLLATDLQFSRLRQSTWGDALTYARVQRWQVLQELDSPIQSPYQRSPQIGLRLTTAADDAVFEGFRPWGRKARLEGSVELEYNRFDLPSNARLQSLLTTQSPTGQRAHMLAHVSAPLGGAAWWLIPRVAINAAYYKLDQVQADGRTTMGRTVPTFSLDHGWIFERNTSWLGRSLLQTLEPRVLYVNTPYRAQENFPKFDSAPKDFNFDSIYTANQFSGIDRVSDGHQLTAGAVSRWVNPAQGDEVLRLGLVQRYLFRDQIITGGEKPLTQRFSDLLLLGAVHLDSKWWLDGTVQFNPDENRSVRTIMRARYSPGPFRTISTAYRLARGQAVQSGVSGLEGQSEQLELAWQWPLYGQSSVKRDGGSCSGAWYSAGRLQYSLVDRKLTDSVLGFEYDSGCWVLRFGVERLSAGRAETSTRLMLQMELVGLSQLGTNALNVLRDNIPGYRRLSSDRSASLEAPYD